MKKIKLLVMDVDGTLTDGRIYIGAEGEIMKAFDVHDGYGITTILPRMGIVPVIITGRQSKIVEQRARELGIIELYQGVSDKLEQLKLIVERYQIDAEQIAYIGDDLNDLKCMEYCGVSACPNDAVDEVKLIANYKCTHNSGHGAIREFIQIISEHSK